MLPRPEQQPEEGRTGLLSGDRAPAQTPGWSGTVCFPSLASVSPVCKRESLSELCLRILLSWTGP